MSIVPKQFLATVVLVVKAQDSNEASDIVSKRVIMPALVPWYHEDLTRTPPYPSGSLLFYNTTLQATGAARALDRSDPNPLRAALEKSTALMWSLMSEQVSRLPREALDSLGAAHQAAVDALDS